MDTIFMNSENSRTSEYHVLVLQLTNKLDLRRVQKSVALSNLSIYYKWKNVKNTYNNNKIYHLQHGVKSLNYQMDYIQYRISKIILRIYLKNITKISIIHQLQYL